MSNGLLSYSIETIHYLQLCFKHLLNSETRLHLHLADGLIHNDVQKSFEVSLNGGVKILQTNTSYFHAALSSITKMNKTSSQVHQQRHTQGLWSCSYICWCSYQNDLPHFTTISPHLSFLGGCYIIMTPPTLTFSIFHLISKAGEDTNLWNPANLPQTEEGD